MMRETQYLCCHDETPPRLRPGNLRVSFQSNPSFDARRHHSVTRAPLSRQSSPFRRNTVKLQPVATLSLVPDFGACRGSSGGSLGPISPALEAAAVILASPKPGVWQLLSRLHTGGQKWPLLPAFFLSQPQDQSRRCAAWDGVRRAVQGGVRDQLGSSAP